MAIKIGEFELRVISGGRFRMDGGAMFGVVPKVLWQKKSPPDEQNRVPLATNCLLIRTPKMTLLIDTGYGPKHSDRQRQNFCSNRATRCSNICLRRACGPKRSTW